MKPETQRITIAEACGWRFSPHYDADLKCIALGCWVRAGGADHELEMPPDYLDDLDAMHVAVMSKSGEFKLKYREILADICGAMHYHNATAPQRAEAFLKALNKWEEVE